MELFAEPIGFPLNCGESGCGPGEKEDERMDAGCCDAASEAWTGFGRMMLGSSNGVYELAPVPAEFPLTVGALFHEPWPVSCCCCC